MKYQLEFYTGISATAGFCIGWLAHDTGWIPILMGLTVAVMFGGLFAVIRWANRDYE